MVPLPMIVEVDWGDPECASVCVDPESPSGCDAEASASSGHEAGHMAWLAYAEPVGADLASRHGGESDHR